MLRWLLRLLILGLIAVAASRVISRVLNREEDFEDYDDIEGGFEFTETPVEIDVAADDTSTSMPSASGGAQAETGEVRAAAGGGQESTGQENGATDTEEASGAEEATSILHVKGIGPTYASRLGDAGINTIEELASADAGELADKVEVIGGRTEIEAWIAQAQELNGGGAQSGGGGGA